ncbi:hypothetical protein AB1E18_002705 [Capra hircus]
METRPRVLLASRPPRLRPRVPLGTPLTLLQHVLLSRQPRGVQSGGGCSQQVCPPPSVQAVLEKKETANTIPGSASTDPQLPFQSPSC